eukprot:gb/GECG01000418.1/.p1 GENE.gb/GECG01000418.1/~~gb/GECG01000418.1/.p1  ORF type:complete len:113 (+),score=2.40 gb/GECG01000418.1/:1-339(+)
MLTGTHGIWIRANGTTLMIPRFPQFLPSKFPGAMLTFCSTSRETRPSLIHGIYITSLMTVTAATGTAAPGSSLISLVQTFLFEAFCLCDDQLSIVFNIEFFLVFKGKLEFRW